MKPGKIGLAIITAGMLPWMPSTTVRGQIIATETFNTYSVGSINGQTGGGTGWVDPSWTGGSGQSIVDTSGSPLTYTASDGSIVLNGGSRALQVTPPDNSNSIYRSPGLQNGDDIYFSFLLRQTAGTLANQDFVAFWFDSTTGGNHSDHRPNVGLVETGGPGSNDDFQARLHTGNYAATGNMALDQTFFLVGRFWKSNPGASNRWDNMAVWLNPTATSSPNATAFYNSSSIPSSFTLVGLRTALLDTGDAFLIDELRLGTTFMSVIPEPGTLGLAGLGALGLFFRRRLRQKPSSPAKRR